VWDGARSRKYQSLGRMALENHARDLANSSSSHSQSNEGRGGFEWRLALLRKRAESLLQRAATFVRFLRRWLFYKGLLTPWQISRNFTKTCAIRALPPFRHLSPAVFDEHAAFWDFLAQAFPLCGAQRRDQYDRVESA